MTNRTPAPDKPSPPRRPTLAPGPALALSLALALALAAPARAQKSPQPGDHGTPGELPGLAEGIEVGLGADQRVSLAKANQLLLEAKLAEAERLIDGVLSYFEKQTADTRRDYVSVANREQFDRYRKEHPSNRELVWLDWSYGRALFLKGWIASAQALEGCRGLAGQGDQGAALLGTGARGAGVCAQPQPAGPVRRGGQVVRDGLEPRSNLPDQ